MKSFYNLYEKHISKNGRVSYKPIKDSEIKIMGHSLEEVIEILQMLDIERIYEMKMCKENLGFYCQIVEKEQQKIIEETIKNTFANFKKIEDKE